MPEGHERGAQTRLFTPLLSGLLLQLWEESIDGLDQILQSLFGATPPTGLIHWDPRPVIRRIVGWTNNVARGKDDHRQTFTKAEFVEGGTVGPAPGVR